MPLVHEWEFEGSSHRWKKKTVLSFQASETLKASELSAAQKSTEIKQRSWECPQRGVKAAGDSGDLHKGLTAETKGDTQLVNLLWDR